jgi:regulator of protease activity HflC (stomatin/prohibitin superfamily)
MVLVIVGLIILIVGVFITRNDSPIQRMGGSVKIAGIGIIIVGILMASIVQIDAGQVGVKSLFGKVQTDVLKSGLHLINPMMEVSRLDIKTQNYTMSGIHDEGVKVGDDAIRVLTADGLEVTIDLTVLFRLTEADAPMLVRETGINYVDKIVRPLTRTKIRDNSVYYEAVSLYSTKRDEFQSRIFKSIEEDFKKRGLFLEQLLHCPNR